MKRKMIEIDESRCNGCGACAAACHEGAIAMVNGKARLIRDDYCDGLGDCLPACPTGAIRFVEREAAAYDAAAVRAHKARASQGGGCPSSRAAELRPAEEDPSVEAAAPSPAVVPSPAAVPSPAVNRLRNWPVQIKLAPVNAPYFNGAKLLVAADCTAYAYAGFHEAFLRGRVALVGCPKLDGVDYAEKLTEILRQNDVREVTVVRMQVPCCGGLEAAVKRALQASGKFLPWQVITLSIDGRILD